MLTKEAHRSRWIGLIWLRFTAFNTSTSCCGGGTDSPYFKGGKIDAFYDRKDNGDF